MRRSAAERYLPVAYLAMCFALIVVLLPTALRPPEPPPPTSAEFSPDAPPDEQDDIILSDLSRASTATAGLVEEVASEVGELLIPEPEPELLPRRGAPCFGNPPRQLESLYSPPCVPAWIGDNHGTTARGVTANEIKIAFIMALAGNPERDGELTYDEENDDSSILRTYHVLQQYFNQNLELFGRQLRFFYVHDPDDPAGGRAAAQRAAEEYQVFAAINETSVPVFDELTRRGVVTFTIGQATRSFFGARQPYAWSATPDATKIIELSAEYLCKKLHGRPPEYADDSNFDYSEPRKFGIISYQEGDAYIENVQLMRDEMGRQCGADVEEHVEYALSITGGSSEDEAKMQTAMMRMRAAGVTTIISLQDFISNIFLTYMADQMQYYPEWFITGFGGADRVDTLFQGYSKSQWKNAFGLTVYEIPAPQHDEECQRAYQSIDPNNIADHTMCFYMWPQMVQLFGAIQRAGPVLTPENLQRAMYRYGVHPPDPAWRMAGGYGPGNWTYPDYAAEIWYDPDAMHPNGRRGAYRFINEGRRYTNGEFTTERSPLFEDPGITRMPRGGS